MESITPLVAPLNASVLQALALAPALLMLAAAIGIRLLQRGGWGLFSACARAGMLAALAQLALSLRTAGTGAPELPALPGLHAGLTASWVVALVQLLGWVVGSFSSRYLQGEARQTRYASALSAVLAAVHTLLVADHWLLLLAAWTGIGMALEVLLCHYEERPFARLAAHKKRVADRLADLLLLGAAGLAWHATGSGLVSAALVSAQASGSATPWELQASAVLLALAVLLRTALMPVHGWLIQVMEAPTPVSALLHAGVVNLGGYVLIRCAPLIDASPVARASLVIFGVTGALLAGFVGLTRISIKVRLAWSTVAQMGFMVMECGLGLYTLALLHLLGHSLYKAQAFLAASGIVRATRRQALLAPSAPASRALWSAPLWALLGVGSVQALAAALHLGTWPLWWSAVLALAWGPAFWGAAGAGRSRWVAALAGTAGLAGAAVLGHVLPLGLADTAADTGLLSGVLKAITLGGMGLMYAGLAVLQRAPRPMEGLRRWSYAGFYVDEWFTRLTLRLWPVQWGAAAAARNVFTWAASRGEAPVPSHYGHAS